METIRCPICGTPNPENLEKCKACNQLLRQSTSELDGRGELIRSGQSPTEKKTSELEAALPAWLRHARQSEEPAHEETNSAAEESQQAESEENAPILPDFSEEPEEEIKAQADPLDWLAGLDSDEDDEEDESAAWLANLQGDLTSKEEVEEAPPVGTPATDEPIMANIPPSFTDEEEEPLQEGELPEWVADLQGDGGLDSDALPDLVAQEEVTLIEDDVEEGSLPDWLSRLSEEAEASSEAAETPAPQFASVPVTDAETPQAEVEDDLPDWIADLQPIGAVTVEETSSAVESVPDEQSVEASMDSELPGWLSDSEEKSPAGESVEEAQPAELVDDLPDWMANLQEENDSAGSSVSAISDDQLPDWLSGSEDIPSVDESTPEEQPAGRADNLPDWMADLQIPGEETSAPEVPEEKEMPAESAGEFPEWMADLQVTTDTVAEASASAIAEEEAPLETIASDDLPDWLGSIPAEDFLGQGSETEDISFQESAQEELASSQALETPAVESSENADEIAIPAAEDDDVPDWLSRIEKPKTGPLEEVSISDKEESPDWLDSLRVDEVTDEAEDVAEADAFSSSPAFVSDQSLADANDGDDADEIFGIEMPDWLSSLAPSDLESTEEEPESPKDDAFEDLSGGELPSWVQAMRPVASVVSDSSKNGEEHVVASSGPLAGLSGILPVGPGMGPKIKPRAHALKLRVNESQQSSAAILEQLLASESESAFAQNAEKTGSIPLLRWGITLLLFLTIGFSLFTQTSMTPSPNIAVPEVGAAIQEINQLPDNGSALLIFDYEAALSAEMQAAAAPLVDHLMLRGEKIAILSTSPTGPALAERFLRETQSRHGYELGVDYVNLGYLPGGASGMLSFVNSPHNAITAQVGGTSVWGLPPLLNINHLTDFSLVIVLTDDVERGRSWVEQASATLNASSTPFLMAVSAQAEPIIYPYYASGQVDGMVSGLSGGATYERLQGQSGLGRKYWDAYSIGLLLAEILIVVGAAVNFLAALRARQKTDKDED